MIFLLLSFFSLFADARVQKPWTILFYVVGDEMEIDRYSRVPLRKLEQVGSSADKWIVVHADLHTDESGLNVVEEPALRYEIQNHPGPVDPSDYSTLKIQSPVVWRGTGESDSASPEALSDFVRWGIENYPAEHYALFLLGHSWGWRGVMQDFRPGFPIQTNPAERDYTMLPLSGLENALSAALGSRNKLDLVVMDTCHGGVLELAYSLRKFARLLLAGPTEMSFMSFDYEQLVKEPWTDLKALLKKTGLRFLKSYARGGTMVNYEQVYPCMSLYALDLEKLDPVWKFFSSIAKMENFSEVFLGAENVRHQDEFGNGDLFEMLTEVGAKSRNQDVKGMALETLDYLGVRDNAVDSVFQTMVIPPLAYRFRLWVRGDELTDEEKARDTALNQLLYLNPTVAELQNATIHSYDKYGERVIRVDSTPIMQETSLNIRPFIAGATWARFEWLTKNGEVIESKCFKATNTFFIQTHFSTTSPYLFQGHTFGAGRNRGLAVHIDSNMDSDLSENYGWVGENWVFGPAIYRTTPFSKAFGWGDLIF